MHKYIGWVILILTISIISYRAGQKRTRSFFIHDTTTIVKKDTLYINKLDTIIKWEDRIRYVYLQPDTIYIYDTISKPDTILENKGIWYVRKTHRNLSFSGFVRVGNGIIPIRYVKRHFEGFMCNSFEIIPTNSLNPKKAFYVRHKRALLHGRIISGVEYPLSLNLSLHLYKGRYGLYGRVDRNNYHIGLEYLLFEF